jgi:uroporphyrinogen-III synthase
VRVLVTRGRDQAGELASLLLSRGAVPVLYPTVRIVAAAGEDLERATASLPSFDWLLLASANAARCFLPAALARGPLPARLRVAAVGPGTSRAARECGAAVSLEAPLHTAEGLVTALAAEGIAGKRFLLPRGDAGREVLPEELSRLGGDVTVVTAYRNEPEERDEAATAALLADPPEALTFASPSSLRNFLLLAGEEEGRGLLSRSVVAVIGEVTARAAQKLPVGALVIPSKYTLEGMVEALEAYIAAQGAVS